MDLQVFIFPPFVDVNLAPCTVLPLLSENGTLSPQRPNGDALRIMLLPFTESEYREIEVECQGGTELDNFVKVEIQ
jgi:hypothetical protein